ncbi:hypothetical protein DSO57_1036747 [Entomophthora muscae]|uniref:Uncharacterized protein n=1 Tax=Entomophthora muscae TaxID=34485 RepID=A0ACC2TLL7_9FUNG|nr:hypothetical protein DSO57_1036747 [Entomophthora muscae]
MASLEQKMDSFHTQHHPIDTGNQSQASCQNSSGQVEYHSLDSKEETNQRLECSIQLLEVVTENGGPSMVTIEKTVQDLKAQQREAHKAVSKACFAAFKANCNRPASPNWQAGPVAIAPHNSLSFFKPANLPRFDRKSNVAMFLLLYQNSIYSADEAMKDATIINCLDTGTQMLI